MKEYVNVPMMLLVIKEDRLSSVRNRNLIVLMVL